MSTASSSKSNVHHNKRYFLSKTYDSPMIRVSPFSIPVAVAIGHASPHLALLDFGRFPQYIKSPVKKKTNLSISIYRFLDVSS